MNALMKKSLVVMAVFACFSLNIKQSFAATEYKMSKASLDKISNDKLNSIFEGEDDFGVIIDNDQLENEVIDYE